MANKAPNIPTTTPATNIHALIVGGVDLVGSRTVVGFCRCLGRWAAIFSFLIRYVVDGRRPVLIAERIRCVSLSSLCRVVWRSRCRFAVGSISVSGVVRCKVGKAGGIGY